MGGVDLGMRERKERARGLEVVSKKMKKKKKRKHTRAHTHPQPSIFVTEKDDLQANPFCRRIGTEAEARAKLETTARARKATTRAREARAKPEARGPVAAAMAGVRSAMRRRALAETADDDAPRGPHDPEADAALLELPLLEVISPERDYFNGALQTTDRGRQASCTDECSVSRIGGVKKKFESSVSTGAASRAEAVRKLQQFALAAAVGKEYNEYDRLHLRPHATMYAFGHGYDHSGEAIKSSRGVTRLTNNPKDVHNRAWI